MELMNTERAIPCGLLVKLEKDPLGDEHQGDDYILGYFDRAVIQPVYRWLEYSPRTIAVNPDLENPNLLSSYPIKLIFPTSDIVNSLEKAGLDYTSWKQFDTQKSNQMIDQFPCISVILINLMDRFKGDTPRDPCGAQLLRFARVLQSGIYQLDGAAVPWTSSMFKQAHCCILPSLGYSDYCILLAEKDWQISMALLRYLHGAVSDNVPVLSTDYFMPMYHIAPASGTENPIHIEGHMHGIRLSIRVHLQPGASMECLKDKVGNLANVVQMSGSSDCLLESRPREDFSELLRIIAADHEHGKKDLQGIVLNTEATLYQDFSADLLSENGGKVSNRIEQAENSDKGPPGSVGKAENTDMKVPDPMEETIRDLREILKAYWHLLQEENRHMRQFNALWNQVASIENICKEKHNEALKEIIVPWLSAFGDCMRRCIEGLSEDTERKEETQAKWSMIEEALEIFITQVGGFLADLSRSDCFFMESERYNHPSVSSATSLLLAYTRWQKSFVQAVLNEEQNDVSKYAFLVRSGGCDTTETDNPFYFLVPDTKVVDRREGGGTREFLVERMPMITHMSEMSLFDCGGAIFRMTHECMHYCGSRERQERILCVIQFASRYLGHILAIALFGNTYSDTLIHRLRTVFHVKEKRLNKRLHCCWRKEFQRFKEKVAGEIERQLREELQTEERSWNEASYMSGAVEQWLKDKLFAMFACYPPSGPANNGLAKLNDLAFFLYKTQLDAVHRFYISCDAAIRQHRRTLSFCALEGRRIQHYIDASRSKNQKWSDSDVDHALKQRIFEMLNQLRITGQCEFPDNTIQKLLGSNVADALLGNLNLTDILEAVVGECFSEAFADLEACMRLNASLSDYLLSFVFENWDILDKQKTSPRFIFRIPVVLRIYFSRQLSPDGSRLTQEARQQLKDAIQHLIAHGMPEERIHDDVLANHIDTLLRMYRRYQWEAFGLCRYLRICKRNYEKQEKPEMKRFQKAFKQIRLQETDSHGDAVARIFTSLVTIGEVSSIEDGKKECTELSAACGERR